MTARIVIATLLIGAALFGSASVLCAQEWIQLHNMSQGDFETGYDNGPYDIALVGDTAYVTWITEDSENRLSSVVVGTCSTAFLDTLVLTGSNVRDLFIEAGYAYIAGFGDGLTVVDVSDASDLTLMDNLVTDGAAWDVANGGDDGNLAFVSINGEGLQIIDVTEKNALVSLSTLDLTIGAFPVEAQTVHVCCSTMVHVGGGGGTPSYPGYATYQIVDASTPESPEVLAEWMSDDWSYFGTFTQHARDIEVKDSVTYLAVDDNYTVVFRNVFYEDTVADTSCYPCYLETVTVSGSVMGLDIQGDYLYATTQGAGSMAVFYLGNPTHPQLVGTYSHGRGSSRHLDVKDSRIAMTVQRYDNADTPRVIILCQEFTRGDVDTSGAITDEDVDYLVDYVFAAGATPLPGEWNGDVRDTSLGCDKNSPTVNAADIVNLNNFVNNGGNPPDCVVVPCADCES